MILILLVSSRQAASWLIYQGEAVRFKKRFSFGRGEDKALQRLDAFLKKHHIKFTQLRGLVLLVQEASLTQVKIFSTMINTIAWQLDRPLTADFYFSQPWEKALTRCLTRLKKQHHFRPVP